MYRRLQMTLLAALVTSGCEKRTRTCAEYDAAEELYHRLTAEVLDPSLGDPRFEPAARAFEAVPEGCERREMGLAIARAIRDALSERTPEDAAKQGLEAAEAAVRRAAIEAAAERQALQPREPRPLRLPPPPAAPANRRRESPRAGSGAAPDAGEPTCATPAEADDGHLLRVPHPRRRDARERLLPRPLCPRRRPAATAC